MKSTTKYNCISIPPTDDTQFQIIDSLCYCHLIYIHPFIVYYGLVFQAANTFSVILTANNSL